LSRLRASLSSDPLDREIQSLVADAERKILLALQRCVASSRKPDATRNATRTRRDLERCLGALRSVRRSRPSYDMSDPDLQPEPVAVPVSQLQVADTSTWDDVD
jgi:hypothetical protein